jgi:hypothetical protein
MNNFLVNYSPRENMREDLELAGFKLGFKFPVGGVVPVKFISMV